MRSIRRVTSVNVARKHFSPRPKAVSIVSLSTGEVWLHLMLSSNSGRLLRWVRRPEPRQSVPSTVQWLIFGDSYCLRRINIECTAFFFPQPVSGSSKLCLSATGLPGALSPRRAASRAGARQAYPERLQGGSILSCQLICVPPHMILAITGRGQAMIVARSKGQCVVPFVV